MGAGCPREGRAAAHEFVEIWRLDVRVSKRGDRIGALVIGDEEQDVRAPVLLPLHKERRKKKTTKIN
jgi:hypothetical protein